MGKGWVDVLFVLINLNFEMRFDNFTSETCILYIDLVETLNFLLRCLVQKVAHINNRKTLCAIPLVTARSFCVCKCCW